MELECPIWMGYHLNKWLCQSVSVSHFLKLSYDSIMYFIYGQFSTLGILLTQGTLWNIVISQIMESWNLIFHLSLHLLINLILFITFYTFVSFQKFLFKIVSYLLITIKVNFLIIFSQCRELGSQGTQQNCRTQTASSFVFLGRRLFWCFPFSWWALQD